MTAAWAAVEPVEVAPQLVRDPSVRIDHAAIEGVQDQLSEPGRP